MTNGKVIKAERFELLLQFTPFSWVDKIFVLNEERQHPDMTFISESWNFFH